jgi:hypothetical protein
MTLVDKQKETKETKGNVSLLPSLASVQIRNLPRRSKAKAGPQFNE